MAAHPFQVLATCEVCRVEGAVVEIVDPNTSTVLESECRMCGRLLVDDREHRAAVMLSTPDEAYRALVAWAAREGETDVQSFSEANFGGWTAQQIAAEVAAGRPVHTSFDAVAWLFGGGMPLGVVDASSSRDASPDPDPAVYARPHDIHRSAQIAARALISVMAGDGEIRPVERAFVDQCMHHFGYPPIHNEEIRHWLPHELGCPEHPRPLVEAMARLAFIDRERDESEWRIVREFARAWGYPRVELERLERQLEQEYAPQARRFWSSLRSFFISEG